MSVAPGPLSRQRGAALLIALVAVALATLMAVSLIERSQRDLARTSALLANQQAWQYAWGMQILGERLLDRALADGLDPASLSGTWTEPFAVPGGFVQGRLIDQHGRFNLNSLAHEDRVLAARAEQVLIRLLEQLGLPRMIAAELREWISGATEVGMAGTGAEFWYASQSPPYRRAGVPMGHVSELRWLRSVDEDAYQRLLPLVAALPSTVLTVNINAAAPELLAALVDGLELEQARRVLADGPFNELQQLNAHPLLAGSLGPEQMAALAVGSRWFMLQARVVLDGIERDYHRLMQRDGSGYDFRWFSQGQP
ncbi:MAG: type II secretion system minor pseudopilin GspK [Wenzhouxiangella sp.]